MSDTPAHDQIASNRYVMHYPPHPPREKDPHYRDFEHIKREWSKDPVKWRCEVGAHRDDFSECDLDSPLEIHHRHVEFALQNGVDIKWLAVDYPGIDNPDEVGKWVEDAMNLMVLCARHHRGAGGIHHASASDFEAEKYVRDLIAKAPAPQAHSHTHP